MEYDVKILKRCLLFKELSEEDILAALKCLNAFVRSFSKNGDVLADAGRGKIGIILQGEIQNVYWDYKGNQNIVASFFAADIFGEAFAASEEDIADVKLIAASDAKAIFISYSNLIGICKETCSFHVKLIKNMLAVIAQKNIVLNKKIRHITQRSTKDKVMSYLYEQKAANKCRRFIINYSRQELADYLAVERSALSAVLCSLAKEGVIKFDKNFFELTGELGEEG